LSYTQDRANGIDDDRNKSVGKERAAPALLG
jgi:hypothetical protein